jgi:hypothetical protein
MNSIGCLRLSSHANTSEPAKRESSSTVFSYKEGRLKGPAVKPKRIGVNRNRNYRQNPSRNIITNIGNQLITYLSNPTKSQEILKIARPRISDEECYGFYEYMRLIKKQTDYYLNAEKMLSFWYPEHSNEDCKMYHKILRTISLYFLTHILPTCILTSTKMKKETKWHHLRVRKQLIRILTRIEDDSFSSPSTFWFFVRLPSSIVSNILCYRYLSFCTYCSLINLGLSFWEYILCNRFYINAS